MSVLSHPDVQVAWGGQLPERAEVASNAEVPHLVEGHGLHAAANRALLVFTSNGPILRLHWQPVVVRFDA